VEVVVVVVAVAAGDCQRVGDLGILPFEKLAKSCREAAPRCPAPSPISVLFSNGTNMSSALRPQRRRAAANVAEHACTQHAKPQTTGSRAGPGRAKQTEEKERPLLVTRVVRD